jgi:membrane protein implicated in regulation of membrane protease activity
MGNQREQLMGLVAHFLLEKRWQLDQLLHLELCLTPELCLLLLQPVVCLTPLLFLILLPPELRLFLLLSVVFLILLLPANQPALQPESFSSLEMNSSHLESGNVMG